jgi:hypothetical protein
MNWFQQNRFLGSFLALLLLATLLAGWFLLHEKGAADDQQTRLETTLAELNRLRGGSPFPNAANLEKTKAQTESYRSSLGQLEEELKTRTLPVAPIQPNEFQAQLRQATNALTEKAAAARVVLPENFHLGFDEYATSLPNSAAAPLLGRELKAIEILANGIVDAHVDALTKLTRTPLAEENPAPTPTPVKTRASRAPAAAKTAPAVVTEEAVEINYTASPAAVRKVLNQLATAPTQLFVIRTLTVKNLADKGPKRGGTPEAVPAAAGTSPPPTAAAPNVNFIVGTEHLNVTARIDIININPSATGTR